MRQRDTPQSKLHRLMRAVPLLIVAMSPPAALAERPMAVDDAGAPDRGGAKLELGWSRDHRERGWDGAAGFAPIDRLELEVSLEGLRDHAADPNPRSRGAGFAAKWVPLQADTGLSAGLKFEVGRLRVDDRQGSRETVRTRGVTGLASWAFASGRLVHLNLGREWTREGGRTDGVNAWGLGLDQPLAAAVRLTLEVFGAQHERPDRQLGLRWMVVEGVALSAAVGRGSDRSFGNAGVAWEF